MVERHYVALQEFVWVAAARVAIHLAMRDKDLYAQILGITPLWSVCDVKLELQAPPGLVWVVPPIEFWQPANQVRASLPQEQPRRALLLVQVAMAARAERDEVLLAVVAAIAPRPQVMHFQEARGAATSHAAAVPVAQQHRPAAR